ncbi:hypothetical protein V2J09_013017 [Rumex salicifolius]
MGNTARDPSQSSPFSDPQLSDGTTKESFERRTFTISDAENESEAGRYYSKAAGGRRRVAGFDNTFSLVIVVLFHEIRSDVASPVSDAKVDKVRSCNGVVLCSTWSGNGIEYCEDSIGMKNLLCKTRN